MLNRKGRRGREGNTRQARCSSLSLASFAPSAVTYSARLPSRHAMNPQHATFLAVIRQIPPGWVMSYGAVARAAGLPRHARHVGVALRQLAADDDAPWWRVVNGEGRVSPRGLDGHDDLQNLLLQAEGVVFGSHGRIDLSRFGWGGG